MSDKIVFGYWGIRGAGQVPRLLLAYTGAVWEDVKYTEREQWFEKDKKELGFDFPNLPYLIEGDFKLTESAAISQYIIARSDKKSLLGNDAKQQARIRQVLGVFEDARTPISGLFWDKEWQGKVEAAITKITPKLELLGSFIGEKNFMFGELTIVDFAMSEFSYYLQKIAPETFAKYPYWKRIRQNLEGLPEIKKYYEQESAFKGPFLPPGFSPLAF